MDEILRGLRLGRRDPVRFLLLASGLRDAFPWLYELGVDAYRASLDDNKARRADAQHRFFLAIQMLRRGAIMQDFGLDKSSYSMMIEIEHMLFEDTESDIDGRTIDDRPEDSDQP